MIRVGSRPGVLAVLAFLIVLGAPIGWGMDPSFSWDVDAIAPGPVLKGLAATFAPGWQSSYGPLPYYLTAALYVPILILAKLTGELARPTTVYPWGFAHAEVWISALIITARALTVAMAVAFAWLAVKRERQVDGARASTMILALLAGAPAFVYYARTSNVDLHYLFWIGLGFVLVEDPEARGRRLVAGAIAAACAVCSKEQVLPLALMVVLAGAIRAYGGGARSVDGARSGGGVRAALAVVLAAVATYAILWRLPWNFGGWIQHHEFLVYEARYPRTFALDASGLLGLAGACLAKLPVALGWPILVGLVLAPLLRIRVADLIPRALGVVLYLGAFILSIGYVYPRFLLPALLLALPLAARAWEKAFAVARPALRPWLVGGFAILVLAGGPALDWVALTDSRTRVENWMKHLPDGATVEVLGSPRFQARVPRRLVLQRTSVDSLRLHTRGPRGDVVLVSYYDTAVHDITGDPALARAYWDSLAAPAGRYRAIEFAPSPLSRIVGGLPVDPALTVYERER